MIAEGCPICLAHNLWLPLGRISPVKMVEIKTKKYRWNSNRKCSSDWNEDHSLDYTELYYTQHQLRNHLVWRRYKKLLRLERTANEKFKPLSPSTKKYEHWRLAFMKICYIKCRISPTYLEYRNYGISNLIKCRICITKMPNILLDTTKAADWDQVSLSSYWFKPDFLPAHETKMM